MRTVARAEPAAIIPSIWKRHTTEMGAHANHDQPLGFLCTCRVLLQITKGSLNPAIASLPSTGEKNHFRAAKLSLVHFLNKGSTVLRYLIMLHNLTPRCLLLHLKCFTTDGDGQKLIQRTSQQMSHVHHRSQVQQNSTAGALLWISMQIRVTISFLPQRALTTAGIPSKRIQKSPSAHLNHATAAL